VDVSLQFISADSSVASNSVMRVSRMANCTVAAADCLNLQPVCLQVGQNKTVRSRDRDRKSTRLNSSHDQISYAVFCLKKTKTTITQHHCSFFALRNATRTCSSSAISIPRGPATQFSSACGKSG